MGIATIKVMEISHWRSCSSCKKPIHFKSAYFECSVSTCSRPRTGFVFCTVFCWETHLPGARHKDAGAIEKLSPSKEQWALQSQGASVPTQAPAATSQDRAPVRKIISGSPSSNLRPAPPKEILIVVSKLKSYIRDRSEMNTSDAVMDLLSDKLRTLCDEAIETARMDGRKTVMERDFK